ncbi:PTS sugar transporter subunit IIA [Bombiscardovia coagulans]|uniref:Ascorbate-specific PTS system EIIA component n=1 Tax=Bombiscardovia coagulans TaxID=686666 RepID=A0A261EPI3_9BIFI|nr:PTS sugar transporter subunit IIA [Bombiscardovia coagulans]OZG48761.1 PTS system, IIA component [Bombiscardovia coagulans]
MLEQYVVADGIRYQHQVSGWRQAIDEVAQPLLDAGSVKPEYVQAIKDNVVQPGGTYMDVGSGVALAHARPEAGVIQTSLSVLHVGQPFLLADQEDHPITTMFCLAAEDAQNHLSLMQALASFLSDEKNQRRLEQVSSSKELRAVLSGL